MRNLPQASLPKVFFALLFIFLMVLYSLTAPRTQLGYADSSELVSNAFELSVPHPPGYPLLTLLGFFVIKIAGFLEPAFAAHLLNALLSALSATIIGFCLFLTLKRLKPKPAVFKLSGVILGSAVIFVSVSPLNWLYAGIFEISGLTKFLCSLFILFSLESLATKITSSQRFRYLSLAFFSFGILVSHYQLAIVFIPSLILLFYAFYIHNPLPLLNIAKSGFLVLIFALIGFILPNLALIPLNLRPTQYSWYFEPNLNGVIRHILRQDYSGYFIDQDANRDAYFANPGFAFFTRQIEYLEHLVGQISFIGAAVALLGALYCLKKRTIPLVFILSLSLLSGPVVAGYMGFPDPANRMEYLLLYGIGERQLLMHYATLIPIIFLGLYSLAHTLTSWHQSHGTRILFVGLVIFSSIQIFRGYPVANQSQNTLFSDYAQTVFASVKQDSVIICASDISCYSLMYHSLTQSSRPDVILLFKNNLYRRHFLDRHPHLYGFEYQSNPDYYAHLIAWNLMDRPVYLTDPDEYYTSYIGLNGDPFYLVPTGYVFEVVKNLPSSLPQPDYRLTDNLINQTVSSKDRFGSGLKNYFASLHYLTGIILANYGLNEDSNRHFSQALSLLPGYQEASQKIADLQNFEGNQLYLNGPDFGRTTLESSLSASLKGNYLQTAYEAARKLTYLDPKNAHYRETLINVLLQGNYTNEALHHLYYLQLFNPDLDSLPKIQEKVVSATNKAK